MKFRGEYAFLSNFYSCPIEYDGVEYDTAEHAYQAAKFDDPEIKDAIGEAETPSRAKRLAAENSDRIIKDWHKVKTAIMYDIVRRKFNKKYMREKLMAVDEPIVEHNEWGDTFWGVCNGEGENNLGKILERVKRELLLFDF